MEPERSLSYSQLTATGPYLSQMHPIHTLPPSFPKIHSNIIFPSTPRYSKWTLSLKISDQILYAFLISPTRGICPAHLIPVKRASY
jgi:hypothetical protein